MNFLAHLWLAERTQTSLAGAILGDEFRGRIPADMPAALALAIGLHRRVDAVTDRHPAIQSARERFPAGARRYGGIVLDIACDHLLARRWDEFSGEALDVFAGRAAQDVEQDRSWADLGHRAPRADDLRRLLLSYAQEAGIELAIRRTAERLRDPQGLLTAGRDWPRHATALEDAFPALLADVLTAAQAFVRTA